MRDMDLTEGERQALAKQNFDSLHIGNMDATTFSIEFWKGMTDQENHGLPVSEPTAFHALKSKLHPGQLDSVQKTVHEFDGQHRMAKTWQEAIEVLKADEKRKREATSVRHQQAVYFGNQVPGASQESHEKRQAPAEKGTRKKDKGTKVRNEQQPESPGVTGSPSIGLPRPEEGGKA